MDNILPLASSVPSRARHTVSMDANSVYVRIPTVTGVCEMSFSRERITSEANKAFRRVVKL